MELSTSADLSVSATSMPWDAMAPYWRATAVRVREMPSCSRQSSTSPTILAAYLNIKVGINLVCLILPENMQVKANNCISNIALAQFMSPLALKIEVCCNLSMTF